MNNTSSQAYIDSRQTASTNRIKLSKALQEHGKGTSRQLAAWSGVDYIETARRMSELVAIGICKGEETILCPVKKKLQVTVWEFISND